MVSLSLIRRHKASHLIVLSWVRSTPIGTGLCDLVSGLEAFPMRSLAVLSPVAAQPHGSVGGVPIKLYSHTGRSSRVVTRGI